MNHVFLSYRQGDPNHVAAVRRLAERLREDKVPVMFDEFYLAQNYGGPNEGWPRWCEANAESSACVLICCSQGWFDSYRGKAGDGGYGAAIEAAIFSQNIYDDKNYNARIRLVILDDFSPSDIPPRLKPWHIFQPLQSADNYDGLSRWVRQRLAMPSTPASRDEKVVFLPECRTDLEIERANLASFLKEKGWRAISEDKEKDGSAMKGSLAFVQLLESLPLEDDSHRLQLKQALSLKIPTLRFRHEKIKVTEVAKAYPRHAAFLQESDVLKGAFDDFKQSLPQKLEAIWNQRHAAQSYGTRRLSLQVIIRAAESDGRWDDLFQIIDEQKDLRSELLEDKESFRDKHDPEAPCHGFVIVCDANSPIENSPKTDLKHCMEIQLPAQEMEWCPPVALLYWPPPTPARWAALAKVTPPKLHKIVRDEVEKLAAFFSDVRQSAAARNGGPR